MEGERNCHETCFHYDPKMQGCSYSRMDFEGHEAVSLGQLCIHPESFNEKLYVVNVLDACAVLGSQLVKLVR